MFPRAITGFVPVIILFLSQPVQCWPTTQFDNFFPSWNPMLQEILHGPCDDWLAGYKNGTENAYRVIDCVLDELKEYRKTEMAASAVILGLLPTILQSLDSSTVDLAILGIRRPLLAILLSITNPASSMTKSNAWLPSTVHERVAPSGARIIQIPQRLGLPTWLLLTVTEYIVTIGAVANVIQMVYQLSVNAVIAFAPKTLAPLPIWLGLAVVIHVASTVILGLRIRMEQPEGKGYSPMSWIGNEFVPCVFQSPVRVEQRTGKGWLASFLGLRWLLDVGILSHTILGTLLFSSLLFFSVADSIVVAGRFAASAIACNTILSIEMSTIIEVKSQDQMGDYLMETYNESQVTFNQGKSDSRHGTGF